MSVFDAFQLVATRRRIWPNEGFCRHLLQLEKEKKKKNESVDSLEIPPIENCTLNDKDTSDEVLSTKTE